MAGARKGVVILPGLGNSGKDYLPLAASLQRRRFDVEIADIGRVDWLRNVAGVLDASYWRGTLKPRPTVDWYLNKVSNLPRFLASRLRGQLSCRARAYTHLCTQAHRVEAVHRNTLHLLPSLHAPYRQSCFASVSASQFRAWIVLSHLVALWVVDGLRVDDLSKFCTRMEPCTGPQRPRP